MPVIVITGCNENLIDFIDVDVCVEMDWSDSSFSTSIK